MGKQNNSDLPSGVGKQAELNVGDTRKPAVLKSRRRVTTGDLSKLAMCAHRYSPDDVMGWYTHDPQDVIRQWVLDSVESVIARESPHCDYERGELEELTPADNLFVGDIDDGPTQAKLVTDGGVERPEHGVMQ